MKRSRLFLLVAGVLLFPSSAFAASNDAVGSFAQDTLSGMAALAALATTFFLIRGGYIYITSTGKPAALEEAKRSIRQALIGLVIVLGAGVFSSILSSAFTEPASGGLGQVISITPIQPAPQDNSLTQVILDAVSGFLQNIVLSATKPILDGIVGLLTSTPSLVSNSVIFNFWLIIVGITDSLFVLVIALLGFQVMGASTFGFDDVPLKELLPRIGLAFLAANTSIFMIDWAIKLCQVLVSAVLEATGGIGTAWVLTAFDPASLLSGATLLITLIFMAVFLVLAIILLLFYIGRLMLLAFGAVLSPLFCLLWVVPKMSDFAESALRAYLVTVFTVFVHVVIIQLSSAFLTLPGQVGTNPFVSALVGIAMFSMLLRSTSLLIQLSLASQAAFTFRRFGGQLFNVLGSAYQARKAGSPTGKGAA